MSNNNEIIIPVFDGKKENFPNYIFILKYCLHNHSTEELQEFDKDGVVLDKKYQILLYNIIINSLKENVARLVRNESYDGQNSFKTLLKIYTLDRIECDNVKDEINDIIKHLPSNNFNIPDFIQKIDSKIVMLVFAGENEKEYGYSIARKMLPYVQANQYYYDIVKKFTDNPEEFKWGDFKVELTVRYEKQSSLYRIFSGDSNINVNQHNRRINNININQSANYQYRNNNYKRNRFNNSIRNNSINYSRPQPYNNYNNNHNKQFNNHNNNYNNNNNNNITQKPTIQQSGEKLCKTCQAHGLTYNNHDDSECRHTTFGFKSKLRNHKQSNQHNPQRHRTVNVIQTGISGASIPISDEPNDKGYELNEIELPFNRPTVANRLSYGVSKPHS